MSESPTRSPAAEQLHEQLKHLDRLRNAHARDHDFKAWRQNALTLVQRLWPDDPRRAERFRRISFTAPSPKASVPVMRQYYERGCIEAKGLLETWYRDVITSGIAISAPRKEEPAPLPGTHEDDFPVLDLGAADSETEARPNLSSVNDEYGFDDDDLATGRLPSGKGSFTDLDNALDSMVRPRLPQRDARPNEAPAPPARESQPPRIAEPRPAAPRAAEPRAAEPRAAEPRATESRPAAPRAEGRPLRPGTRRAAPPKRALKDMLGFDDSAPAASAPPPNDAATVLPPAPVRRREAARPAPPPPPPAAREPEFEEGQSAADFLDRSPVMRARAKPVRRPERSSAPEPLAQEAPAAMPARAGHPVATTLSVMASEIERLGVPESERSSARALLLSVAFQFERRSYDWTTLRDLMAFTMEYPPLARRVLPLLIPYLDVAA